MGGVLSVHDLTVEFPTPAGPVRALEGVSFALDAGETLALVGESGSGKTLAALSVLGLVPPPGRVVTGRVFFQELNLLRLAEPELQKLRGRALAMVFQDPLAALHPLLTIERQLTEVLEAHERSSRREARARAAAALAEVGLGETERVLAAHPHQLSGGMRQRVLIAMALLLRPQVVFADEPTTALDATLQRQVLELLRTLARRHGTAVVLISHDLERVAEFADRVQVLYAGRTVESARTAELFRRPLAPYTRGLLASAPRLDGRARLPPALDRGPAAGRRRAPRRLRFPSALRARCRRRRKTARARARRRCAARPAALGVSGARALARGDAS
jgi:ABC-type dipeptide/oligopeptide/nickel transport system ATPase component